MVVTEMSTPTSAPDLPWVSASMPAAPASTATITVNRSGWEMKAVNWRLPSPYASRLSRSRSSRGMSVANSPMTSVASSG